MNLVIFMTFIFANDITARTIKTNAQGFCTERLSNITDLSTDDYKHDTTDQLKSVTLKQELKTESAERIIHSDSNEVFKNSAKLNPTKVTEGDAESENRNTYIDYDTNTSLQLNEANYKYSINTDDHSDENNTDFEHKDKNKRALAKRSDTTNIRELRSELLNHLLEYFMNIIKEEKHSETRKNYSNDEMKLEDKFRNYYHSDLEQLFYEDNSYLYENVTEYTNGSIETEGGDAILDKQNEEDDFTNLDNIGNVQPFESEATRFEENKINKVIPNIINESHENDGVTDEEPEVKNPAVEIEDNSTISDLINNEENNHLNKEETNTDFTAEETNQTQNMTEIINNNDSNKKPDSSEQTHHKQTHNSQTSQIDENKSQNSEKIISHNKDHTRLRQFFFGLNKNENLEDIHHETSSGCCKNNYILQLNIHL